MAGTPAPRRGPARTHAGERGNFPGQGTPFFSGDYLIPGEEVILRLPGGSETDYRAVTEPVLRGLPPACASAPATGEPYILKGKE